METTGGLMGERSRRRRRPPGWLTAAALLAALAAPARAAGPCRETLRQDRIAAFEEGALRLASGARVRLVDLRLPDEGAPAARADAVLRSLAGEDAAVATVGEPDRWGRIAAAVRTGAERPVDLAELLVGEGLALVDAGPRDALCRPALLAAEARARARRLGIWSEGGVLPAADAERLAAAAGRFVLVEGRVVSVGVRRERTYLNFGRDWARDFAVTIPRRTWATLNARGVTAEGLRGRPVRVRGTLERRTAPSLDLASADMLEVLDRPGTASGTPE